MKKQIIGNIGIATLIAVNVLLWLVFTLQSNLYPRSASQVFAEMLSSSGLILMACALLLSNKPRLLEPYFGGLDRMYVTHKTIALLGVILIVFHQMLVPKSGKTGPGFMAGDGRVCRHPGTRLDHGRPARAPAQPLYRFLLSWLAKTPQIRGTCSSSLALSTC